MEEHDEHDSGEEGLGTQTGANEPGSQNPDHTPGATPEREINEGDDSPEGTEAPDNPVGDKNPVADDSTTEVPVPQEGEMEDDPAEAGDATDGA